MELIVVKTKIFTKVVGGDVGYCLCDDVEVGVSGNHHPTFSQNLLPIMSLSTLQTSYLSPISHIIYVEKNCHVENFQLSVYDDCSEIKILSTCGEISDAFP